MKEIGDRLLNCPKGVCRIKNFDKVTERVLEGNNTVGLTVSVCMPIEIGGFSHHNF